MPSWSTALSIDKQERDGTDDGDKIQRERDQVLDDAVPTQRLERPHERTLDSVFPPACTSSELRLSIFNELRLAIGDEGGVEDLRESGFEEEGACEEGEEEDGFCADDDEGENGSERTCEEGEDGGLGDVGEKGEDGECDCGGGEGFDYGRTDRENDVWIWKLE